MINCTRWSWEWTARVRLLGAIQLAMVALFLGSLNRFARAEDGPAPARGPLTVLMTNPRFFTDGSGKAVFLAGSHTWGNLQDYTYESKPSPPALDWDDYLKFQKSHNFNFFRLWAWESALNKEAKQDTTFYELMPYERTGPGLAQDGKPRFDVEKFNQAYFDRMRHRIQTARDAGIYVSIMLFEGFSVEGKGTIGGDPLFGHYYNPANNINGVGDGTTPGMRPVTRTDVLDHQEAYIRKVIDTVSDLDNVLYEITNEDTGSPDNTKWQYHVINFIHDYEKTKPKQHPVGMTVQYPNGSDDDLYASPADWISPKERYNVGDGRKVVVNDTDHAYYWANMKRDGLNAQVDWVWRNFTGGNSLLFMDPYLDPSHNPGRNEPHGTTPDPYWDLLRESIGRAHSYAQRMDLAAMTPHPELASTGNCLAHPGTEYLLYLRDGGETEVSLGAEQGGSFDVEWMNPHDGMVTKGESLTSGGKQKLKPPFEGDAVLYIHR